MTYQKPDLSKFPIDKVVEDIHNISKASRNIDEIEAATSSVLTMIGDLEKHYQS